MSKDRVIQLQECAEEIGFETIQDALDAGYHVVQDLVSGTFKLEKIDEQEQAHEAWLRERDVLIGDLTNLLIHKAFDFDIIERAIKFIKEAHD